MFKNLMKALNLVIMDLPNLNEFQRLEDLIEILIAQISLVSDVECLKAIVVLIQSIFIFSDQSDHEDIRMLFARKQGFHELLKKLLVGDMSFNRVIKAFFRQNLTYMISNSSHPENEQDNDMHILLDESDIGNNSKWLHFLKNRKFFK